jgi:hypothetical protein
LFESSKRGAMFFLIFDALIMHSLIFHDYILNVLGMRSKTEENVETITEAMNRIVSCLSN